MILYGMQYQPVSKRSALYEVAHLYINPTGGCAEVHYIDYAKHWSRDWPRRTQAAVFVMILVQRDLTGQNDFRYSDLSFISQLMG